MEQDDRPHNRYNSDSYNYNSNPNNSRWSQRLPATLLLAGRVLWRLLQGKWHRFNFQDQLVTAGPEALGAVLLINYFAGMIFAVQTARELVRFGALEALGGAFALAFCRELAPVLTAGIVAGQVGSAYAAEIGSMRVTEQLDALQMLRTNPVDYLVTPRVLACCVMLPVLTVFGIVVGIGGGIFIATQFYDQSPITFLGSIQAFLQLPDLMAVLLKSWAFGILVAIIGCSWGLTTIGGARGVGQSATAAVVTIWGAIFIADFFLSLLLFGRVNL
jgi:phospholipid/cholesterol/gamma-HCH transport system permease protein